MTTTHGQFSERTWIPKSGQPTASVTFGHIECQASNDSMMTARMKAWRVMAVRLAELNNQSKCHDLILQHGETE